MARVVGLIAAVVVAGWGQNLQRRLSPEGDYADQPAMVATPEGEVLVTWVAYDGEGADRVRARRYADGRWGEVMTVTPEPGDFYKTAAAVDGDGRVLVAWAARVDGNVDIYGRWWAGGRWSAVERLTRDPQPDIHHRLAAGPGGNVYLCWQSFRTGDGNIYLKSFRDGQWGEAVPVTTHEAGDWEPAVAADREGRLYIVYDTYRHGDYDVYLRVYENGELSPEYPVAATEHFEARATVACDAEGRAWVAWDRQGKGWGLDSPEWNLESRRGDWGPAAEWVKGDPKGVSYSISLRRLQKIGLAVFSGGRYSAPEASVTAAMPEKMALSHEIPHLTVDRTGSPWLLFRRFVRRNDGGMMAIRPGGWDIYAMRYEGGAWGAPVRLTHSTGSNDQRVATVMGPDGKLWVAYPSDDRVSEAGAIETPAGRDGRILLTSLSAAPAQPIRLRQESAPASRPYGRTAAADRRNTIASGEKRYGLYWGDLHRHTEVSGDGGYDGTLWDMYRYAMDVAELDFIAGTDHFYGGFGPDGEGRTFEWWQSQKLADLLHVRGAFLPLFGYERSLKWPYGHRNVINLRRGTTAVDKTVDDNAAPGSTPRGPDELKLWEAIRGQEVITIPHTIASGAGTDWSYNDPALEPLMEIYQGCRMSYEVEGAPRVAPNLGEKRAGTAWSALEKGYKVGFVASSDHRSTHISYAAVYAEEPTREAIFDALRKRHAYAATDNIVVDVRVGDAILGDVTTTDAPPELQVMVRGTAPIHRIQIIKNNTYVYDSEPGTRETAFTFRDADAEPGESYYYVRIQQVDGQMAWASPIWVTYQP